MIETQYHANVVVREWLCERARAH